MITSTCFYQNKTVVFHAIIVSKYAINVSYIELILTIVLLKVDFKRIQNVQGEQEKHLGQGG